MQAKTSAHFILLHVENFSAICQFMIYKQLCKRFTEDDDL